MTVEEAIVARILQLASVTALVSTRVHLMKLPQSPTYPCVRVQVVVDRGAAHLRGGGGPQTALVQVDAFASELNSADPYVAASAVAEAIRGPGDATALEGWRGVIGSPGFSILSCECDDRRALYDGADQRVVTMSVDYRVIYQP